MYELPSPGGEHFGLDAQGHKTWWAAGPLALAKHLWQTVQLGKAQNLNLGWVVVEILQAMALVSQHLILLMG